MIQVWTQKCAVKRQVWMSIFHIINFKITEVQIFVNKLKENDKGRKGKLYVIF
jgi:hypothetical protein